MEGETQSTFTDGTCEKLHCSPSLHFFMMYGIDILSYPANPRGLHGEQKMWNEPPEEMENISGH